MRSTLLFFLAFFPLVALPSHDTNGACCVCEEKGPSHQLSFVQFAAAGNFNCKLPKDVLAKSHENSARAVSNIRKISLAQALIETESLARIVDWDEKKCQHLQDEVYRTHGENMKTTCQLFMK